MDRNESVPTQFAEKQIQQLADLIPSMVWTCLADGYADYFNQRWYELTGLTAEESVGLAWADAIHPDDRERVKCEWQSAVETGNDYEIEVRHRMADGRYRWHLVRAIPVRDDAGKIDHWFGVSTDIDEKHESEEVAEAMTRAIVEADSNAIFTVDDHGIIQFHNLAAAEMFGYEPSNLLGRNIKKLLPKYFRDEEKGFLSKHLQAGQRRTNKGDVCGQRKDGSTFPSELTVQEVTVRGNQMHAVVIQDSTVHVRMDSERIQSQHELEREKAFLETIFNGLPDALMFASLDRKLTHCNEAAYQMFGYSPEEFIGQSVSALYANPQEYKRQGNERFNKNASEHLDVTEIQWRRKNGEAFTGETVGTIIRDIAGEPLGFLALIRDVTERERTKEFAQENQRSLSTLLSNLPGAAYRCQNDEQSTMELISDGCLGLCGYSSAEILINKPRWAEFIHEDDFESVRSGVKAALSKARPFRLEYRIRHRDGTDRWLLELGQGVFEEGCAVALEGFITDITELTQAREKLVQSERLAAMGQMMSSIAHESRNALQRIQAGVDMLNLDIAEGTEAAADLGQIARARSDLQTLLDGMRDFAAPVVLDLQKCNLADVWQQSWRNLNCLRENRQAELVALTDGVDLHCAIDSFRIEQIFRNLIENSFAACVDPVKINIACSDWKRKGVPMLRITVRDNGPGLTLEQQNRIFEAFYSTKPKGTGLGMAIAMKTIEAHNGTLAARNGDGGGAEFVITLPREQQ